MSDAEWEAAWAPYDDATYEDALRFIGANDIVLDIGAGDLRFARRAARRARAVIAIEQRAELLKGAYPPNLRVLCGDALTLSFPKNVTVAALLMRHCRHLREYISKLRECDCARLITNARWGMDVEQIELHAPRVSFDEIRAGWYACECGATGFAAAEVAAISSSALVRTVEVSHCPRCAATTLRRTNDDSTHRHRTR